MVVIPTADEGVAGDGVKGICLGAAAVPNPGVDDDGATPFRLPVERSSGASGSASSSIIVLDARFSATVFGAEGGGDKGVALDAILPN